MYRYAENGSKLFNEFKIRNKTGNGQTVALTFYDSTETKIGTASGNAIYTVADDVYLVQMTCGLNGAGSQTSNVYFVDFYKSPLYTIPSTGFTKTTY